MQAQHRLRKNSQFQYVYKKGKGSGVKEISLIYVPATGKKRVGFAVGKKIGNAVTRNLVKRRLRAAFSAELPLIRNGMYIVSARSSAAEANYASLCRSLKYLLKKQKCYQTQQP